MKVQISADDCIGCGLCAQLCSDIFEMQDDKAVVVTETVDESNRDKIEDSVQSCPTEAIAIIEG